jgi:hypothetical protein
VIELHCNCKPEIAAERFFRRQRHAGHLDSTKSHAEELSRFQRLAFHGALGIGHLVEINTDQPLQIATLLEQLAPRGLTPMRPPVVKG